MAHKPPHRTESNKRETRRQHDKRRGSARERGYSTAWDKFAASLKSDPDSGFFWCRDCEIEGRLTATQELHHTEKVRDMVQREVEMFDTSLLMPLCKAHHSIRTAKGE